MGVAEIKDLKFPGHVRITGREGVVLLFPKDVFNQ
jgi:hypothetical protein